MDRSVMYTFPFGYSLSVSILIFSNRYYGFQTDHENVRFESKVTHTRTNIQKAVK